jgi:glutamate mutase epsilon subunit
LTSYVVIFFTFVAQESVMESQKSENTRLDNSTYNVMVALGREADFLHSTIDTYIADAQRENKTKLVEVWNNIKQDKQEHLDMLKNCLENEVEKGELNK